MIVVVGLSHRTAPIAVREQLAIASDEIPALLKQLVECTSISEALVVSTCNRVEVIAAARGGKRANLATVAEQAQGVLLQRAHRAAPHLYAHVGRAAVQHVFRVAASLDSLVVGESQILGQVKDAFETAREVGTVGPALNRGIARAIHAAKLVRTHTQIGTGQVSVPTVAVDLARQIFGDLKKHTVVLVGAGEMAESVARLLQGAGARLVVVGRTFERAKELAERVQAEPRPWTELTTTLIEADVVITSTSAPTHVIGFDMVSSLRRGRRGRSLFFIDLAVPRDVEPRVGEHDGIFLYNIDDFSKIVAESLSSRQKEAERAEELVRREVDAYERWAESELATPTIVALRRRFRRSLDAELERSFRGKLKHLGGHERAALHKMLDSALNKMLHAPTMRLRELASNAGTAYEDEELTIALRDLFGLDDPELMSEEVDSSSDAASDPNAAKAFTEGEPAAYVAEANRPGDQH